MKKLMLLLALLFSVLITSQVYAEISCKCDYCYFDGGYSFTCGDDGWCCETTTLTGSSETRLARECESKASKPIFGSKDWDLYDCSRN